MGEIIKVGMADYKLCQAPDLVTTIGLGSCVGIIIYDPILKISGLAHIMLPYVSDKNKDFNIAKYADTAIPQMIEELKAMGGCVPRFKCKLAGGAQMFAFNQDNDILKIGERNVKACKEVLSKYGIPVISEDTGGNKGRTIIFDPCTEMLSIKVIGTGTIEI